VVRTFDPEAILRTLLEREVQYVLIGGLAATLYGSPFVTTDADIVPARDTENLVRLAQALSDLQARIRVEGEPEGIPFDISSSMLSAVDILNLVTRHGDLDLTFTPSGTQGFTDLRRAASDIEIHGVRVSVASLADVIRSKEAADREKDRLVLPTLRQLLDRLDKEEQ
jgi:hypothetical protein